MSHVSVSGDTPVWTVWTPGVTIATVTSLRSIMFL